MIMVSKRRTMLPHDAMTKHQPKGGGLPLNRIENWRKSATKIYGGVCQSPFSPPDQTDCTLCSEDGHFSSFNLHCVTSPWTSQNYIRSWAWAAGWASGLYRDRDWDLKRVFAVFEEAWVKTMADNRADNSNS